MKIMKLLFLIILPSISLSQKNYNYVNQSSNEKFNSSIYQDAKNDRTNSINIIYSSNQVSQYCGIIANNIKESFPFNQAILNIQKYVTENYTIGGTWNSRQELANRIMRDIMTNQMPIAGTPSANYLKDEPFAKDLILFSNIAKGSEIHYDKRNSQYNIFIDDSPDTQIPLNIISNHPLLLVNNKRGPQIISTSKSIQIK
jgi:hypothetical protein